MKKEVTVEEARDKAQNRLDGLENVFSRKGSSDSKTGGNVYNGIGLLPSGIIRDLYNSGGIGAKVITRVADDITRKGFSIENDKNADTLKQFNDLGGTAVFNEAIRWARAYGGSLIVMTINDGRRQDKPLRTDKIRGVEKLKVYEAGCSNNVTILKRYDNPKKPNFNEPEIYHVNTGVGTGITVHESRVIRLDGRSVDSQTKLLLDGWGGSELQPVYEALMSMFSVMLSGEQVLDEMIVGTLKLDNMDSMVADSEGEEILKKRMDYVDKSKNNENTILIDANEEYERHTTNLSGMSNIQHNTMTVVAGASDIPSTFLYGSSPDGQNATGSSDEKQYYGKIDAERLYFYEPALIKLLKILSGDDNITITFPSLQISSMYDVARSFDHTAKGLKALVESGILLPQEAKGKLEQTKLVEKLALLE